MEEAQVERNVTERVMNKMAQKTVVFSRSLGYFSSSCFCLVYDVIFCFK